MLNVLTSRPPASHSAIVGPVEQRSLASELKHCLLGVRSKDRRVQQLKKDIQRGLNKAPDTLASILVAGFNGNSPAQDRVASTISGFFSSRVRKLQRKLCDLMHAETVEEGEFNNVQIRVAQGDLSTPTLLEMKTAIREYRAILDEMDAAVDVELFARGQP